MSDQAHVVGQNGLPGAALGRRRGREAIESTSKRARGIGSPTEGLAEGPPRDGHELPPGQRFSRCASALGRTASYHGRDHHGLPRLHEQDLERSCSSSAPSSLAWAHDPHGHDVQEVLATGPVGARRRLGPLPLQQQEQQQFLPQPSLIQQQQLQLRHQLHQQLHQHPHGLFVERQMAHAALSLSPPAVQQQAIGGYGFLPPSSADLLLSQQQQQQQHGILRKHSLARLEMSADILRQKELESLHNHQRLLEAHSHLQPHPHSFPPPLSNPYPHQHTHHVIGGNSAETARHSALMLLQQRHLQHQLSHRHQPHLLTHQLSVSHARGLLLASRASHPLGRRGVARKSSGQKVTAYVTQDAAPMAVMKREPRSLENNSDNGSCDSDGDGREGKEQRSDRGDARHGRDLSDASMAAQGGDSSDVGSRRAEAADKSSQESLSKPSAAPLLTSLSPSPQTSMAEDGEPGTMSATEEEEDMRAWSVDNVCTFVAAMPGCAESAQAFRHHAIDGETLPLLTETHLLSTLGLRLGPALKILTQVARKVDRMVCVTDITTAASVRATTATDTTAAPVDAFVSAYQSPLPTEPLDQDSLQHYPEDYNTIIESYPEASTRASCPMKPYNSNTCKTSTSGLRDAASTTNSSAASSPEQPPTTHRESDLELATVAKALKGSTPSIMSDREVAAQW
ncbi:unnamed protein product [Lampetra planeri]